MSSIRAYSTPPAAILRISGEDHADFLQSQGTADLRGPVGLCRYCLWLDHKGLIHGDSFVLKISDTETLLVSYETPAADLIAKFQRHIIADDVGITDETSMWKVLSIDPDCVSTFYRHRRFDEADAVFHAEADGYAFRGRRLGPQSADYLVPFVTGSPLEVEPIPVAAAEALRIQAAIPSIPRDIPPATFNPVEANILSALSFDKGCYLGQEVVARVHRLGRLSSRMVSATAADGQSLEPVGLTDGGRPVGALTSVATILDTVTAVGWLKSRYPDGEQLLDGRRLQIATLPPS